MSMRAFLLTRQLSMTSKPVSKIGVSSFFTCLLAKALESLELRAQVLLFSQRFWETEYRIIVLF